MNDPRPAGGPILTFWFKILLAFSALGIVLIVWRFLAGLGATTALSDGYPWGLWIAFDVVTGTAFACGGYAMAIVIYIFNKGKYHPLIRPAILTSALGYSIAGASVVIDIGRPWEAWKLPLFVKSWNLNSALLEVALCIMAYCVVLYLELTPAFLEKARDSKIDGLRNVANKLLPIFDKALIFIVALGMLLPSMHQSSLGTLMLLTGPRLHPLWNTPIIPFLFLMTAFTMGYAIVVFESTFSSLALGRKVEFRILKPVQKIAAWGSLAFVIVRLVDVTVRGALPTAFRSDLQATMFWIENILFLIPVLLLLSGTHNLGMLFRQAIIAAVAGAVYRFDAFLVAFNPGPGWHYFPSVPELFTTLGLVAMEIAIYAAVVKTFPILSGIGETYVEARHY
jgi:Ni/Fe-hydrogenase subunit HybB-like protein